MRKLLLNGLNVNERIIFWWTREENESTSYLEKHTQLVLLERLKFRNLSNVGYTSQMRIKLLLAHKLRIMWDKPEILSSSLTFFISLQVDSFCIVILIIPTQ